METSQLTLEFEALIAGKRGGIEEIGGEKVTQRWRDEGRRRDTRESREKKEAGVSRPLYLNVEEAGKKLKCTLAAHQHRPTHCV